MPFEIDLTQLSNPPLPVELWLSIFATFTYSDLHRARAINHAFSAWVLSSGYFDRQLFRSRLKEQALVQELEMEGRRKVFFHPIFRHVFIDDAALSTWTVRSKSGNGGTIKLVDQVAMQENATFPPVSSLASFSLDLPESRSLSNVTSIPSSFKDPSRPISVHRLLELLEKLLGERVYLPGSIDRVDTPWVRSYERSSGRISWRGEYTSMFFIMVEAFQPWEGKFKTVVDKKTGLLSVSASGFQCAFCIPPPLHPELSWTDCSLRFIQCLESRTTTTGRMTTGDLETSRPCSPASLLPALLPAHPSPPPYPWSSSLITQAWRKDLER